MVFPAGWSTQKLMMPSRHQHVMGGWLDFTSLCWVTGMLSSTVFESGTPKSRCKQCRDLTQNSLGDIRVTVCFWWEMVVSGQSRCESSPRGDRQKKRRWGGEEESKKQISSKNRLAHTDIFPLPGFPSLCASSSPSTTRIHKHGDLDVTARF